GGSLALYAWRAPALKGGGLFAPVSREGSLILNNLLLTTACATVFIGTLYPLLLDAMTGDKISVGPPFFNATFVPLMIPLIIALGFGPMLSWKRSDLKGVVQRLQFALVVAAVVTAIAAYITWGRSIFGAIGLGLSGWLAASVLIEFGSRIGIGRASAGDVLRRAVGLPRAAWGMMLAHLGFAVLAAGATGASVWQDEAIQSIKAGDSITIAGYEFTLRNVDNVRGPNYVAQRGVFTVKEDGTLVATLAPERRRYLVQGTDTTESAIYSNGIADLYAVLGEPQGQGRWIAKVYFKPLVPWIWLGGTIMVLGGIVSLTDRRLRVGAPTRKQAPTPASAPAPAE
ncbi:MAG: heme lyase NrfEFG subunit NrfE, partial [Rhodospirillaceae bacterium]|nr:heme lyase NrfEFG subunit NrfE [Rhodospirillaceae bacterium]